MTERTGAGGPWDGESDGPTGPVIRDKRRLDPETGQVREPVAPAAEEPEVAGGDDNAFAGDVGQALPGDGQDEAPAAEGDGEHPDTQLAADRLEDLRRLQAEYVNYKRRVDRDRARDRETGAATVVEALLPVLDDLHMAKEHGELAEGPLLAIAEKLEATLGRFGVERLGAVGEVFDPAVHEALMHLPEADLPEGATETTIVQVMQPGFKVGDRVVRAARVAVADPA
ncbi:nucleotide exchange factor GrpE [Ornithinimicrobium ciconiae]|uniref:nucleotide exchange factor GrpE n=1 Tax=Ornithinimicrobium ciconiae TaxID=2594265 RepID=UPI001D19480B|nr:nucleotide exchange factor GrpE [Ornithinimicrobium ciconiae]